MILGTMKLSDREYATPYQGRKYRLNRKKKNLVTGLVVVLFFLLAGIGYVLWSNGVFYKQEKQRELTGVLNRLETVTPKAQSSETAVSSDIEKQAEELVVYVCGAVNEPGIYSLAEDSRLYEAIALAGGFSAEADPAYHNLARPIADGERIYILSVEEAEALEVAQQVAGEEGTVTNASGTGLINLNTATAELLMELPGIGESKAAAILAYRSKIGSFTSVEEILNVSGIGEAMFEKIKDKITLK